MNERIRQLAEQAGSVYQKNLDVYLLRHDELEKFAELIVHDCIRNLEIHATCFDGEVGRGVKTAARLTKEHFGVEE
jgi:hypothetical protein